MGNLRNLALDSNLALDRNLEHLIKLQGWTAKSATVSIDS
jgi:hypothetical protein